MGESSEAYRRALARDREQMVRVSYTQAPFQNRGLNERTINALVAAGIDAPERLLFMTVTDLRAIPGIGKVGLTEIEKYRSRFIPRSGEGV